MKSNCLIEFILIFALVTSLICCTKNESKSLIVFDVNGNFSEKTLNIQDIADVEYLSLETNDDYLFSSFVAMSDSFIICLNHVDYSLPFFSRKTGKALSKVSREGNGPEEYVRPANPIYDEKNDELFLFDYGYGIKVYGRDGSFKKKLPVGLMDYPIQSAMFNYDADNLLLNYYILLSTEHDTSKFIMKSKQDGSIKELPLPYKKRVEFKVERKLGEVTAGGWPGMYFAVRNGSDLLLTDYSLDTVYRFTPDHQLIPVLVRKPSIQEMEHKILLHSWLETDVYLFFSTEKAEYDWDTRKGFHTECYLMEKNSGKFFKAIVQMNDYKGKELIIGPSVLSKSPNSKTGVIVIPAMELIMANEDKKLSGKLKKIAEHLTEDDEFIIMIIKLR